MSLSLFGIILGLVLLMFLAYKGYSIIWVAPVCAVVVAVSAFTPACLARSLAPPISAAASLAALLASVAVLRTVSRSAAVTSALNVQLERVRPLPA